MARGIIKDSSINNISMISTKSQASLFTDLLSPTGSTK